MSWIDELRKDIAIVLRSFNDRLSGRIIDMEGAVAALKRLKVFVDTPDDPDDPRLSELLRGPSPALGDAKRALEAEWRNRSSSAIQVEIDRLTPWAIVEPYPESHSIGGRAVICHDPACPYCGGGAMSEIIPPPLHPECYEPIRTRDTMRALETGELIEWRCRSCHRSPDEDHEPRCPEVVLGAENAS
jgi:hypothetical protein